LVPLAGEGATIEKRISKAEDLADAVVDVKAQQDLLRHRRDTLLLYLPRKDLAVADIIAVSQQLGVSNRCCTGY